MSQPWGYTERNGPNKWYENFPIARKGQRQSPIDIVTKNVAFEPNLGDINVKFGSDPVTNIENTGVSFMAHIKPNNSVLSDGPLTDEFELLQIHAHWGNNEKKGSEHTINGEQHEGELHMVFWNKTKYASFNDAVIHSDGLAVLGFFLKVQGQGHEEFQKIIAVLPKIRCKGSKAVMVNQLDLSKFLPTNEKSSYWTYPGSLTTPPLLESVTWILMKEPLTISEHQFKALRSLLTCEKDLDSDENEEDFCMCNNARPTLPLGDRVVRTNRENH